MNRTEPVIVTVLRHGEVAGRAHVFRGAQDEALSEQGREQMRHTLARVAAPRFDMVASSPLRRCADFAQTYAMQQGIALQILPGMREIAFGEWEGLSSEEVEARSPAEYQAFRHAPEVHAPPGGETLDAFRQRIAHAWQTWLAQAAGSNRLLITHAGVMRALLMELFGFTRQQVFQIALPEAACMRISCLHGQPPFLLSVN